MKNFCLLICLLLVSVFNQIQVSKVNAQNYLISFTGTGESSTVSTVEVENLNSGESLILNGNDILHLISPTGISTIEGNYSSVLRIYPNPLINQSIVEISPPEEGKVMINVYDMTGKAVAQKLCFLEKPTQQFRLSGLKKGLYMVEVLGYSYRFSGKLLCSSKTAGIPKIEVISSVNKSIDGKTLKKGALDSLKIVDMPYQSGDRLKYTVSSGIYRTIKTDIPTRNKALTFNFIQCTDGDNNNYPLVEIGDQMWMAENLKTTRYNDGRTIPLVTDNDEWKNLKTPGVCWYDNTRVDNEPSFGALYNWFAANTAELCPNGWHIPTDAEWKTLELFLGMTLKEADATGFRGQDQGAQLKNTTGWDFQGNGSNYSGFAAYPSGARWSDTGNFHSIGIFSGWWSSSEIFADGAVSRYLFFCHGTINRAADYSCYMSKQNGFSIRCIKD